MLFFVCTYGNQVTIPYFVSLRTEIERDTPAQIKPYVFCARLKLHIFGIILQWKWSW